MKTVQKVMETHNELAQSYHTLGKFIKKAKEANKDPDRVRMKIIDAWNIDKSKLQVYLLVFPFKIVRLRLTQESIEKHLKEETLCVSSTPPLLTSKLHSPGS